MSPPDDEPALRPSEKLAALVAQRKAAAGQGAAGAHPGGRKGSERAAAARSASKSKPAMRK